MAAARFRAMRTSTIVVGALATALLVLEALAAVRSQKLGNAVALAYVADAVVWAPWSLIGILIAARGVRTRGTTALAFAIVAVGLNWAAGDLEALNGMMQLQWQRSAVVITGFIAARSFLRSCQLFPRPLAPADVLSQRASIFGMHWLQRSLVWLLWPWTTWMIAGAYALAVALSLGLVADVPVVLLGLAFLRVSLRVGNRIVRRRVTWIIQTSLFFLAMFLAIYALLSWLESAGVKLETRAWVYVGLCVPLGIGGCASLAMAVFSAGAVNPSLVLRATVVYGAAISLLLFALNVITSVLVDSATNAFGLSDRLVAATFGALAGALLEPFARMLRRFLERGAQTL